MEIDPTKVSFSQAQGLKPLPRPLKLGELSKEARIDFWNAFYVVDRSRRNQFDGVKDSWYQILSRTHARHFREPLDEFSHSFRDVEMRYKSLFLYKPYNEVFDLLIFLLRISTMPVTFKAEIKFAFESNRLAYALDMTDPATIYPATTPEEGRAILDAVQQLNDYGLNGARNHLIESATFINQGNWPKSVHESINAVESVARQIAPGANTLSAALKKLRSDGLLEHRALEQGLDKLYGYTSDEQGVRHSLSAQGQSNVGQDEAVFMLGACASFASYLWRKHLAATS